MEDNKQNSPEGGVLYVVSTPIGNLEDITLRALRVLKTVDLIAAENVAHTKGLCERYSIKTKITSYNQHNQKAKAAGLIRQVKGGRNLALVSDAGTPGVSDPGPYLIGLAADEGVKIVPIPGPSAVIAAISISGLPTQSFVFLGFLPNKPGKRRKKIEGLQSETRTMVFFEAPHRLKAMLADLRAILGDRRMVMVREMTKVFEEFRRGPVSAILDHLDTSNARGEITLVVAGKEGKKNGQILSEDVMSRIERLLEEETGIKEIASSLSSELGLPYRKIYKECLAKKRLLNKSG